MALHNRCMTSISSRNLVDAVLHVERMSFKERDRLAEEVHAGQPNLFYSVLVLQRYGATLVQIEVVLNLLLVFYEAMKISGSNWPVVSEDVQERCLTRVSGRARFIEGLSPQLQTQAISAAVGDHPEQQLLAYVFGKLKESDLLGVKTEAEKMLMLARVLRCRPDYAGVTGRRTALGLPAPPCNNAQLRRSSRNHWLVCGHTMSPTKRRNDSFDGLLVAPRVVRPERSAVAGDQHNKGCR